MDQNRDPGGRKPANVFTVAASGAQYTTVQAAVDAAVAAGASITSPYEITYTQDLYVPYDQVIPAGVRLVPMIPFPAPKTLPQRLLPHNGVPMVSLRCDDGAIGWVTADYVAGLSGATPSEYARVRGVPLTFAIIDANTTTTRTTGYMTPAEVQTLAQMGNGIASHGYLHSGVGPRTGLAIWQEIVYSRLSLEAKLGLAITPIFVQPGGWTNEANFDTQAKCNLGDFQQAIRGTYEASQAYYGGGASQHFGSVLSVGNTSGAAILTNTTAALVGSSPVYVGGGSDSSIKQNCVTLIFHGVPSDWPAAVDYLKTLHDAGSIFLCTVEQMLSAMPVKVSTALIPWGDIDNWSETAGTGCTFSALTVSSTVITAWTLNSGGTGYKVGDRIAVVQGAVNSARLQVATLAGSAVATLTLVSGGTGYTTAAATSISVLTTDAYYHGAAGIGWKPSYGGTGSYIAVDGASPNKAIKLVAGNSTATYAAVIVPLTDVASELRGRPMTLRVKAKAETGETATLTIYRLYDVYPGGDEQVVLGEAYALTDTVQTLRIPVLFRSDSTECRIQLGIKYLAGARGATETIYMYDFELY